MKIIAATAWKENLHWLSDKSFNRLKDAKLVRRANIAKATQGLSKVLQVPIEKQAIEPIYNHSQYTPTSEEFFNYGVKLDPNATMSVAIKKVQGAFGKPGTITLDKEAIKKSLRLKTIPKHLELDLLHHELNEARVMKKSKHLNIPINGHFSPSVLVNERKMFNQTGGLRTRGYGDNILNIRSRSVDDTQLLSPLDVKQRLKNSAYKKIVLKYTKGIKNAAKNANN